MRCFVAESRLAQCCIAWRCNLSTICLTRFGCCAVYVFVSHRLFIVTNDLKSVVIPSAKVSKLLWRNFGMMAVAVVVLYVAAYLILRVLGINERILAGI